MRAFFHRWFPGEIHHLVGYYDELRQHIPASGRILDLGCGCNLNLAQFRTPQREAWGVDLEVHPELIEQQWFRLMGPGGEIPFGPETFDLVACNMVLEHVADPNAFLAEVIRVLRPNGKFVGHSISGAHYVTFIRRMFGLLPHSWNQWVVKKLYGREEHDTFPAYYRLSTPRRIAKLAAPLGLRLVEVNRYAWPGYFEFSPILYRGAVLADWALDKLAPGTGRIYFSVILQKAPSAEGLMATPNLKRARAA
jgi:SAM-dependent methyltransferase